MQCELFDGCGPDAGSSAGDEDDLIDKALAIDDSSLDGLLAGGERLDAEFKQSYREANWLQKADGILTGVMTPAFGAEAQAIVRNVTEKRLAAHAVATAIFRKSQGRWPKDLSELNSELDFELKLDESALAPPGGKPFGYRIDPGPTGEVGARG